MAALVCPGCCSKILSDGELTTQIFLTVPEAGKYKVQRPADSVPSENTLPGLQTAPFLLRPHVAERERVLASWSLFKIPPW